MALTGTHLVRVLRSALQAAKHFWPHVGDRMEVRRQALKLRHWGLRTGGSVMDLTFESIRAMPDSGVFELRLDDVIGGQKNIRVIFLVPPEAWEPNQRFPLPVLWVLEVVPKKRQEWTAPDIRRFRAKRAILKEQFYSPESTRGVM